jgi:hypothetical protein
MTDAKNTPAPESVTDVAKKESSKQSKKLKSTTVKDVISKNRTMTGSPPDQININPVQESMGQEHTAVMAFGRFNPPTVGHEKLIHKVEQTAKSVGGSAHIIASHSEGDSKNPLPSDKKVEYIKKVADHGTHVYASSKAQPTLLHHAAALHKHAHHLVVVAGQDRVQQFHDLLHKYNGKEGPHGFYNFKSIKVVSAGQRDPDAEGTKGMSGTKMREHAKNGNEAAFRRGLPKALHAHAGEMMKHIQRVTGVEKVKKEEMDTFALAVHNFIMENTPITNAQRNALDIKSIKSGIDLDDLVEAYAYGYQTGLMSETQTPEQIGFQSVNSLIANSLFEGKRGLWDNIHAKQQRIKHGSGEKMRKPGSKGAPTKQDFINSQEETIHEISDQLVGRVNTLRRIGPDIMKGTPPTPHKTAKGAETLAKSVDKVRNNSKVGAPPMKEDVHSMFEEKYIKQHGLYKYNKRSGMWDHQRSVSPETKDQYLDIFKKDEPNEHFVVAKNRPKHNPLKENVDSVFAEKFGKEREAVARSGQEPKDKDLVMRSGDRKTSDKGYRTQSVVKQVIEAKDKGEYDYEGDMAMSQLRSIMHNAQQINDMLKPNTNMPEWVQSKITLAADYISTCADYLESNKDA